MNRSVAAWVLCFGAAAEAQTINWQVDNGAINSVASGVDFTVNLGTVAGAVQVRI